MRGNFNVMHCPDGFFSRFSFLSLFSSSLSFSLHPSLLNFNHLKLLNEPVAEAPPRTSGRSSWRVWGLRTCAFPTVFFGNVPGDGHGENGSLLPPRQPSGPPAPPGVPQLTQQARQGQNTRLLPSTP